jgi:CRP-like cAMP-binding protein
MLSTIDRIIFLKEVPFFEKMTITHLKMLAGFCEEKFFEKDSRIFNKGDAGGILYMVVNGRVGIEQERRAGSFARLADIDAYSYFGEENFFDNSPRSSSAITIRDTLILQLRREPMIELTLQNPNVALELINVLSERLRENNFRVAEQTRAQPRQLDKLYKQF